MPHGYAGTDTELARHGTPGCETASLVASIGAAGRYAAPVPDAMRFESTGRGRPLVLLSGAACGPSIFANVIERLRTRYAIHAGAIAGFAGEPAVEPPVYDKLVESVVARLQTIGPSVLVGHSFGGTVLLSVALEAPELALAVVLIEGAPALGPIVHHTEDAEVQARRAEAMMRAALDGDRFVASIVASMRPMFCDGKLFEPFSQEALASDAMAVAGAMSHATTLDLRPRMSEIVAPVLLMLGEWPGADPSARDEAIWAQLAPCPRRSRVTIPGAAHFPMLDRADDFADALERFLAEEVFPAQPARLT